MVLLVPLFRSRRTGKSYIPPWALNESPDSIGVLQVVDNNGVDGFAAGEWVTATGCKWQVRGHLLNCHLLTCSASLMSFICI